MFSTWQFRIGFLDIRFHMYAPQQKGLVDGFLNKLMMPTSIQPRAQCHLIAVKPNVPDERALAIDLPESGRILCQQMHKAWTTICRRGFGPDRMSMGELILTSDFWIEPWDEAIPSLNLIGYHRDDQAYFFYFTRDDLNRIDGVRQYIHSLATRWHVPEHGLVLHSSAVAHPKGGFLFLGESGAGKSTVARLAASAGIPVLSDDLVYLLFQGDNQYPLSAAPSLSQTFSTHPERHPLLRAVFRLVQDDTDRLVRLPEIAVAKELYDAFSWTHWAQSLGPEKMAGAFAALTTAAQHVPGYELHFRKTPDFWKMMDNEF